MFFLNLSGYLLWSSSSCVCLFTDSFKQFWLWWCTCCSMDIIFLRNSWLIQKFYLIHHVHLKVFFLLCQDAVYICEKANYAYNEYTQSDNKLSFLNSRALNCSSTSAKCACWSLVLIICLLADRWDKCRSCQSIGYSSRLILLKAEKITELCCHITYI